MDTIKHLRGLLTAIVAALAIVILLATNGTFINVGAQAPTGTVVLDSALKGTVQVTCGERVGVCGTIKMVVSVPKANWKTAQGVISLLEGTKVTKVITNWETDTLKVTQSPTSVTIDTTYGLSGNITLWITGDGKNPPFSKIGLGMAPAASIATVDYFGQPDQYVATMITDNGVHATRTANVRITDGTKFTVDLMDHTTLAVYWNGNRKASLGTFQGPGTVTITAPRGNTFFGIDGSNYVTFEFSDTDSGTARAKNDQIGIKLP